MSSHRRSTASGSSTQSHQRVTSGSSGSSQGRDPRPNPTCEICEGRGQYMQSRTIETSAECRSCDGNGQRMSATYTAGAVQVTCCHRDAHCRYCRGWSGTAWQSNCPTCDGQGEIITTATVQERVACGCRY